MNRVNGKKACGTKGGEAASRQDRDGQVDYNDGNAVQDDVRDVVGDRIEAGELVVYGVADPSQGPIRSVVYSREKIRGQPGKISDGRIVSNQWKVVKNELIVQGVKIDCGTQEH